MVCNNNNHDNNNLVYILVTYQPHTCINIYTLKSCKYYIKKMNTSDEILIPTITDLRDTTYVRTLVIVLYNKLQL